MTMILGQFTDPPDNELKSLEFGFWMTPLPLEEHWGNIALTADFVADYVFPFLLYPNQDTGVEPPESVKESVRFVVNEMLENSMKYHNSTTTEPIQFRLILLPQAVMFYTSNSVSPAQADKLQNDIQRILHVDPNVLYLQQVERIVAQDAAKSELGLLTLVLDYKASLGWKFEPGTDSQSTQTLTTLVRLEF